MDFMSAFGTDFGMDPRSVFGTDFGRLGFDLLPMALTSSTAFRGPIPTIAVAAERHSKQARASGSRMVHASDQNPQAPPRRHTGISRRLESRNCRREGASCRWNSVTSVLNVLFPHVTVWSKCARGRSSRASSSEPNTAPPMQRWDCQAHRACTRDQHHAQGGQRPCAGATAGPLRGRVLR